MKLGFAIITGTHVLHEIIRIEHRFHNQAGFADRLGTSHNLPHTTIFQGDMREDLAYAAVADRLAERFVSLFPQRQITFSDVVYVPEGWYFWQCEMSDAFAELHRFLLAQVKPYIVLDPQRMQRNTEEMPPAQKDAIRQYGYRYADAAFFPHITIGRAAGRDESLLKALNREFALIGDTARISRITVYKMGNNGTHAETLYEKML